MVMHKILLVFSFLVFAVNGFAQTSMAGKIVDGKNSPVSYANIQLLSLPDSSFVEGCVAKKDGTFDILLPDSLNGLLKLSSVGYQDLYVRLSAKPTVTTFVMKEDAYNLSGVTVTARKRIVKSLVDRYQIDVDGLKDYSFDMMDLLSKAPGVIVDNGVPSIWGKSGFRVMVNNHIQKMNASQAVAYLKSLDLNHVDKVEIIQNPPAKYEAEGDYGIIHIITKRDQGSLGLRLADELSHATTYLTNSTNFSMSMEKGKLGVYAMGSYQKGKDRWYEHNSQGYKSFSRISDLEQVNHPQDYNLYASADYSLSKQISLGGNLSWYKSRMKRNSSSEILTKELDNGQDSVVTSTLDREMPLTKRDATFYFSYQAKNVGVEFSGSYFDYDNQQNSLYHSWLNVESKNQSYIDFQNDNSNHLKGFSGMADFNLTLQKTDFTFGGKWTASKTPTEAYYTPVITDYANSSTYKENIYAFYVQAMRKLGEKVSVKIGGRYEKTSMKTIMDAEAGGIDRKYGNWFPNMFLSYNINANNTLRLTYTGSIERPNLQYISPFVIYSDTKDYTSGNPYLKPMTTNRVGLDYTFMGNLIVGMYYSVSNNMISQVISMDEGSRLTETKWENARKNRNLGLNFMYFYNRLKWLNATFMAFGAYVDSKATTIYTKAHSEYAKATLMMNLNFVLDSKRTWTSGLNARYVSAEKNCDTKIEAYGNLGCYVQGAFLNRNLTANLSVSNLLEPKLKGESYSNGMVMKFCNKYSPLTIKLSLAYTLGVTKRDKTQNYGDKEIQNRL